MPNYSASGTEPLKGGAPKTLHGGANAQPGGSGTACGGTENLGTTAVTLSAGAKSVSGGGDHRPEGVQSFPDTVK